MVVLNGVPENLPRQAGGFSPILLGLLIKRFEALS